MLKYFYWLFFAAFILSFYVWQQTQSMRLGYKVDNLRLDCERLEQDNKEWRLRVNCLLSMDRLDKVAKEKQLVNPNDKTTIYLPS